MPHNRYYIDSVLEADSTLVLKEEQWHHLAHVQRARVGEAIELVNGQGVLAKARVAALNKRDAAVAIEEISEVAAAPSPLILAQAIPRMSHLEWIIEKGCELGATAFWLFPGNLSEKESLNPAQMARLKAIAVAAMKQCGRLDLPEIVILPPLVQWTLPQKGTLLFGDTEESAPYLWEMQLPSPLKLPVVLFIGPEKGFDATEVCFLRNKLNASGTRLHKNILRAETAPLVALSLIQRFL